MTLTLWIDFSALLTYYLFCIIILEGYVKKAIQRGLRPEFAIFCGLHEEDPRAKQDPRHLTEWFSKDPMHYIESRVGRFALLLMKLMRDKLIYEGKVVVDKNRNDSIVSNNDETGKEEQTEDKAIS